MTEFELIENFFRRDPLDPSVSLGNGDDAAVFHTEPNRETVISVDSVFLGRHVPSSCPPVGFAARLLGRGLSDLAAMGARPRYVLLSLTLPTFDPGWIDDFATRFHQLCVRFGIDLIGGDTTKGPLSGHLTVIGDVPKGKAIRREGAKTGDELWVFGPDLGGARAYLEVLNGSLEDRVVWAERYWRPEPQLITGQALSSVANAMIDISDGLCQDLTHLLNAADKPLLANIWSDCIPLCADLESTLGKARALEYSLTGGDDYCLLVAISPKAPVPNGGYRIGSLIKSKIPSIVLDGEPLPTHWKLGWDHSR